MFTFFRSLLLTTLFVVFSEALPIFDNEVSLHVRDVKLADGRDLKFLGFLGTRRPFDRNSDGKGLASYCRPSVSADPADGHYPPVITLRDYIEGAKAEAKVGAKPGDRLTICVVLVRKDFWSSLSKTSIKMGESVTPPRDSLRLIEPLPSHPETARLEIPLVVLQRNIFEFVCYDSNSVFVEKSPISSLQPSLLPTEQQLKDILSKFHYSPQFLSQ